MSNGMSVPPLPDLDALSLDELKKLVVQLLVRVSALEEEIQQLRAENARLKALPQKPKLAAWTRRPSGISGPGPRKHTGSGANGRVAGAPHRRLRSAPWSSRPRRARGAAASSPSPCRI